MSKVLLISESTIKKNSLINNNLDGMYLTPTIEIVQQIDLDTLIGPALKDKLCNLVGSGAISSNENAYYKELLDDYVTNYMIWAVMAQIQISVNYKMTNSGVIQNQDEKKTPADYATLRALQKQYDNYAAAYATKMKDYIDNNIQHFPEARQCKNYEVAEDVNPSGIFFPSSGCRRSYIGK